MPHSRTLPSVKGAPDSNQRLCELQLPAAGWKQVDDAALLQLNLLKYMQQI